MISADSVAQIFHHTIAAVSNSDHYALTQQLEQLSRNPEFYEAMIAVVSDPRRSLDVRLACAIHIKRRVEAVWDMEGGELAFSEHTRHLIKSGLLALRMECPDALAPQVAAALEYISGADFPHRWPELIPCVQQNASSTDVRRIMGALDVLDSVLLKFREFTRSSRTLSQQELVLECTQDMLKLLFVNSVRKLLEDGPDRQAWSEIFYLASSVFYSLNSLEMTEFFEENVKVFFEGFVAVLSIRGLEEKLYLQVLQNITLYANCYQEQLDPFLFDSVRATMDFLSHLTDDRVHDSVACSGLQLLSSVALTRWQSGDPFQNVEQLFGFIFRNACLRDSDFEEFKLDPLDFVKWDYENADSGSRRGAVLTLVKNLNKHDARTKELESFVSKLLCGESPLNYDVKKDAAATLITAMAVKTENRAGVVETYPSVDLLNAFKTVLLDDFVAPDVNAKLVVKAAGLKFLSTFRNQLPDAVIAELLPHVLKHIDSQCVVVHTYAAWCLQRILTAREPVLVENVKVYSGRLRFTNVPQLIQVVPRLLALVDASNLADDNVLVARAFLTVLKALPNLLDCLLSVLEKMVGVVNSRLQSNGDPHFIHYVFETVSFLVQKACDQPALSQQVESTVLCTLTRIILNLESNDFTAYCFQLLSIMVGTCASPKSGETYNQLFAYILDAKRWSEHWQHVPAMVHLLIAFFCRREALPTLNIGSHMISILERMQFALFHTKLATTSGVDLALAVLTLLPVGFYEE
ncbi:MAG: uncharacterized protein KVP18_001013 [Porospora cf. gigantea A]|uniref:uncharacterized protein n=1 Tax=Porospora cf. gigantea A TaxID=2853593 RepID=UPI00355AB1F9|nr:MAG: hypothetical protein KVP18_001013 [Porospora cf. gigantea A]